MMEEGNEENSVDVDQFAIDLLRRAKERSEAISGRLNKQPQMTIPKENEDVIEKALEELETVKKSVVDSNPPTTFTSTDFESTTTQAKSQFQPQNQQQQPQVLTPVPQPQASSTPSDSPVGRVNASHRARSTRLSALARTINEWEDDLTHHSIPGSRFSNVSSNNSNSNLKARVSVVENARYSPSTSPTKPRAVSPSKPLRNSPSKNMFTPRSSSPIKNHFPVPTGTGNMDQAELPFASERVKYVQFSSSPPKMKFFEEQPDETIVSDVDMDVEEEDQVQNHDQYDVTTNNSPIKRTFHFGDHEEYRRDPVPEETMTKPPMSKSEQQTFSPSPTKAQSQGRPVSVPVTVSVAERAKQMEFLSSPPKKQQDSSLSLSVAERVKQMQSSSSTPSSPPKKTFLFGEQEKEKIVRNVPLPQSQSPPKKKFLFGQGQESSSASSSTSSISSISVSERIRQMQAPSSPGKRRYPGGNEPDPCTLSVAERARLFESAKFQLATPHKPPTIVEMQPKKPPRLQIPQVTTTPPSPTKVPSHSQTQQPHPPPVPSAGQGLPPPPPPMPFAVPNSSTPTNENSNSKRRSTSPTRGCGYSPDRQSVKRIKVSPPKPGHMYPSLTDIETETEETEVEGGYGSSEAEGDESQNDSLNSLESAQSLGTKIENIAKACSPIRSVGGKPPVRYRPSEDFSATFACAAVDAFIDEALEGQDMTGTTFDSSAMFEGYPKAAQLSTLREHESSSEAESSFASHNESTVIRDGEKVGDGGESEELDCSEGDADTTASSSFTCSPLPAQFPVFSSATSSANQNTESSNLVDAVAIKASTSNVIQQKQDAYNNQEETFVPRQLVHTVSFYRKQQQQQQRPQNRQDGCPGGLNNIAEHPEVSDDSEEELEQAQKPDLGEEIRKLELELDGRNHQIAQASKALTWCKTLVGFSDSSECIDAERILLIETQKRLALLNSIHRLKTEGALSHQMPDVFSPGKQELSPSCKGNMKISDIVVTLRRDYFSARRAECNYHFICLIKNKHHVEYTPLLSVSAQKISSTITFPNAFSLENLDPGFQVNLEIYYLETAKEFLPHEAKYRINAKKDHKQATLLSPLLTPSKKGGKMDHSKTPIQSPAGPDTVKTSSFKFCGGLSVDISSLQRQYWELDKASGPLSGRIGLKIQCSAMGGVEHRGFLTLFEDVSGYGAWVRRWCRLGPTTLEFWKYPEDETEGKKPPLSTLNLHDCVTSKVRPAPREVCARANTLLLVTTRAHHPNDKNTLVTSCHRGYTAVRHLISADLREERDIWNRRLNKALANLRAWDPEAKQSVDDNLF